MARWPAAAVLATVILAQSGSAGAQQGALETAVKATYLYKFVPFVEWPPPAFADASTPVKVCVAGEDPFGAVLDQAVAGQLAGGRPIELVRLQRAERPLPCHVLFAAGSARQPVADILRAADGQPVLTVTDGPGGPVQGIIHFVIRDNRVRFEVDARAAARNQVALSSKLLGLAVAVRQGG